MSRGKGKGLDYDVAPDLVQGGAPSNQRGAAAASSNQKGAADAVAPKRSRLDYEPEPFVGAHAPPGPPPSAVATLQKRGQWEGAPAVVPARTPERVPESPARASPTSSSKPVAAPSVPKPPPAASPSKPAASPSKPPRAGRAEAEGDRVARTIRLAPNVDAQVQAIASRFGVDLTAAVSIAITHGHQALATAGFVKASEG